MSAEREAAIRARLARAASPDDQGMVSRPDLAYLLALVDRKATALDAVRELAERIARIHNTERERVAIGQATPQDVDFLRRLHDDLRAALAAADDGGTRGRDEAGVAHRAAKKRSDDHALDNGTTTEGDMR